MTAVVNPSGCQPVKWIIKIVPCTLSVYTFVVMVMLNAEKSVQLGRLSLTLCGRNLLTTNVYLLGAYSLKSGSGNPVQHLSAYQLVIVKN